MNRSFIFGMMLVAASGTFAADQPVASEVWMALPAKSGEAVDDLFSQPDKWKDARSRVDEVMFSTKENVSDRELKRWLPLAKGWGLKVALRSGIGQGSTKEVFDGLKEKMDRFAKDGGEIDAIVLEKPMWSYVHQRGLTEEKAVEETSGVVAMIEKAYPNVRVGLMESFPQFQLETIEDFVGKVQARITREGGEEKARGLAMFQLEFNWADKSLYAPTYVKWDTLDTMKQFCAKAHLIYGLRFAAAEYPQMREQGLADDMCWFVSTMYQEHEYKTTDGEPLPQYVIMSAESPKAKLLPDDTGYGYTRLVDMFCRRFLPENVRK